MFQMQQDWSFCQRLSWKVRFLAPNFLDQDQATEEEEGTTEAEVAGTVIETEEIVEDQTLALLPEEEIEDAEGLTLETEREEAPAMTEEETRVTPEAETRALEEASHLEER